MQKFDGRFSINVDNLAWAFKNLTEAVDRARFQWWVMWAIGGLFTIGLLLPHPSSKAILGWAWDKQLFAGLAVVMFWPFFLGIALGMALFGYGG